MALVPTEVFCYTDFSENRDINPHPRITSVFPQSHSKLRGRPQFRKTKRYRQLKTVTSISDYFAGAISKYYSGQILCSSMKNMENTRQFGGGSVLQSWLS